MNTLNKEGKSNSNRHSIEESTMSKLLPAIMEVKQTGYSTHDRRGDGDISGRGTINNSHLSFDT